MSKSKKQTQEQQQLTRRQFIKSTAAGAAAIYMAPSSALGKDVNGKDVKGEDGKYKKKECRWKENFGKIFKTVEVICYASMFQDVGNHDQEINKQEKRKKNSGGVAQKIFLNTVSEKKG